MGATVMMTYILPHVVHGLKRKGFYVVLESEVVISATLRYIASNLISCQKIIYFEGRKTMLVKLAI